MTGTNPDPTDPEPDPSLNRYAETARRVAAGETGPASGPFGVACYQDDPAVPAAAAGASLACGNPVALIDMRPGDTVLDLGSGGGLDALLSARRVAPGGRVIGLDATPEMVELARRSAAEAGATNVEFLHGRIENIPLPDQSVDAVISNCVVVLSTDKAATAAEIARVLRPGGRVAITDLIRVDDGDVGDAGDAPTDCADRAVDAAVYEDSLRDAGLVRVSVQATGAVGGGLAAAVVRARQPTVGIRPMVAGDWPAVRDIYRAGIATGNATFETGAPTWKGWDAGHLDQHRLVATDDDGTVVGWAALSPVSSRCVYAGVVENSVYVAPGSHGRGVGTTLLDVLVAATERAGIWTIQTGIFPENEASVAIHQAVGFRVIGRRERIGQLDGAWRDTLFLERRSSRIT